MAYEPYRAALSKLSNHTFNHATNQRKVAVVLGLSKQARIRLEWFLWKEEVSSRTVSATCKRYGITPKTYHKWFKRYDRQNLRTLEDQSRAPHTTRGWEITKEEEVRILTLRRKHIRWGKMKIIAIYKTEHSEAISSWKVQRVIEKHGLYYHPKKNGRTQAKRLKAQQKKRIAELTIKPQPGFLFCLDTVTRHWLGTKRYILTAIDKTNKLAFARMYNNHSSKSAADFLRRLQDLVGDDLQNIQTDNGSEFHGYFNEAVAELNLDHYWSRVRTPKDNAVNERFNRTLDEEFIQMGNMTTDIDLFNARLLDWLIEYNSVRPHQTLNYLSPMCFIQQKPNVLPMWSSNTST